MPPLAVELGTRAFELSRVDWITTPPESLQWGEIGKFTIVEFWATWCPPCRISIPHLSKLQLHYASKGVTVVGISNEPKHVVSQFFEQHAPEMRYYVGIDMSHVTYRAYMSAFGVKGIPHAFIVSTDGRVLWHGHPLQIDEPLAAIVEGRYDLEAHRVADRINRYPQHIEAMLRQGSLAEKVTALQQARELLALKSSDRPYKATLLNLVSQVASLQPELRPKALDLARENYQTDREWLYAAELYARFLEAEGRTTEAQCVKSVVGHSQARQQGTSWPVGVRGVPPATRMRELGADSR